MSEEQLSTPKAHRTITTDSSGPGAREGTAGGRGRGLAYASAATAIAGGSAAAAVAGAAGAAARPHSPPQPQLDEAGNTGSIFPATSIKHGAEINQEAFMQALRQAGNASIKDVLEFRRPSSQTTPARQSSVLSLDERQLDVMYALAGCTDVRFKVRNVKDEVRSFLDQDFQIDKGNFQTFFKNREPKPTRTAAKRGRMQEQQQPPAAAATPLAWPALAPPEPTARAGPFSAAALAAHTVLPTVGPVLRHLQRSSSNPEPYSAPLPTGAAAVTTSTSVEVSGPATAALVAGAGAAAGSSTGPLFGYDGYWSTLRDTANDIAEQAEEADPSGPSPTSLRTVQPTPGADAAIREAGTDPAMLNTLMMMQQSSLLDNPMDVSVRHSEMSAANAAMRYAPQAPPAAAPGPSQAQAALMQLPLPPLSGLHPGGGYQGLLLDSSSSLAELWATAHTEAGHMLGSPSGGSDTVLDEAWRMLGEE